MKTLSNRRLLIFVIALCILVILPSVVSAAEAQAGGFRALDTIVDTFANSAKSWVYYFRDKALALFWPLATIALFLMALPHLFRLDLPALISELVRYLITTGFFYYLILSVSPMRPNNLLVIFTQSFTKMAAEATGNLAPEALSPSGIIGTGLSLVWAALKTISTSDIPGSMVTIISSVCITVVFVFIAGKMTVLLIELWIKAYISPFVLGFGAWSGTRDIALNYIRSMIALGLKVMTYGLIIGVGKSVISDACAKATASRTVTVVADWNTAMTGRGSTMEATTNIVTHSDMLVIMSLGLVLLLISESIPSFISGLVGNAGSSGAPAISVGSTMAAGRMATSVASGGVTGAVTGASTAANVYRQTRAQSQAGEGMLFKDAPGSGQKGMWGSFAKAMGTDGIKGATSYGVRFGAGLAKNTLSAAATAVSKAGSRTSMGALDAAVKLNMAKDDNARAIETKGGSGAVVENLGSIPEASAGKISGESSSTKLTAVPAEPEAAPAVKAASLDAVNSYGSMMQQSLANVAGTTQQATEQMVSPNNSAAPDSASTTPRKTGQVLPTEPPPLPQEGQ